MHENAPVINATKRDRVGSRYARRDRSAGRLPAVVYGHKQEPVAVTVDAHATLLLINRGEKIFKLHMEGQKSDEYVLLKALQYDFLGTNIVHCDLELVDLDERIHTKVPLHLLGQLECKGLKVAGSILIHPVGELEVECSVKTLPDFLELDIRNLEMNGTLHAREVPLPPGVTLVSDPEGVVARIVGHVASDDGAEAATVGGAAAPEVLTEKKKDA